MSRHKAYPEYKESGAAWVEKVPSHWSVQPLKFMTSSRVTDGPHETPRFVDVGIPFLSVDGIQNSKLVFEGCRFISLEDHERFSIKCLPKKGDVLLGKAASVGKVAYVDSDIEFNVWSPLAVIAPRTPQLGKYIFYSIQSSMLQAQCDIYSNSNTQKNLGMMVIDNLVFAVAPDDEALRIANFLDHETAKIDTLIAKQQELIKLLKEKRQAVISHAVTKGLNPNAPMRDSGVEWLGEVPAHWNVKRLKHAAKLQSGIPKGKDLAGKQTIEVPMLRVANVQDGYLNLSEVHLIQIEPEQLERYELKDGDVLMNEGGDNDKLGRGAVWRSEIVPCIHQNHVFAIRPIEVEPEWLDLVTRAAYAKYHFYCVAKQSTNLASISSTNIKETPLIIPPEDERDQIISFITLQLEKFDSLELNCNMQIALLQERRTALISAAVTGKIDVRDWQPPGDAIAA